MQSRATTVEQYLASLPDDRRATLNAVRDVFRANADPQLVECMNYGMLGWVVPHSIYPPGYHCKPETPLPYAGLASQKGHMSLYLMCVYGHAPTEERIRQAWAAAGKKLDMGKACIRFKRVDDLVLDAIADVLRRVTVKAYIEQYEAMLNGPRPAAKPASKPTKKASTKTAKKPAKKAAARTSRATATPTQKQKGTGAGAKAAGGKRAKSGTRR